ncbi:MAG: GNAT family N-acetyltransferase [Actinobacteria bacterium]|nr:GNAT family N-acetyltransferase [Actinomycetota bacterium]
MLGFALRRAGWLNHLYVDPPSWRAGVGRELLARAVHDVAEGVDLWVFQRNAAARAFYMQERFVEVERTDGRGNEEQEPDIRMHRAG